MELLDAPMERPSASSRQIDGVAVVRWPDEQTRVDDLARRRVPRLLLVAPGAEPPASSEPLSDWVREPADERDVQSRIVGLRSRASTERPILDDYGLVWRGASWVALSPIEARLIAAFLARPGRVISRRRLELIGWPGGRPNSRSVDGRIKGLRPRLAPVGVRIHTVRGQGYLAEIQPQPEAKPA